MSVEIEDRANKLKDTLVRGLQHPESGSVNEKERKLRPLPPRDASQGRWFTTFTDLLAVRMPGWGWGASGDELFKSAKFARDEITIQRDLMQSENPQFQGAERVTPEQAFARLWINLRAEKPTLSPGEQEKINYTMENAKKKLLMRPEVAGWEAIVSTAALQGRPFTVTGTAAKDAVEWERYQLREEEPGRIHHEYRNVSILGKDTPVDPKSQAILKRLAPNWGGTDEEMRYYGDIDGNGEYVNLVAEYADRYGDAIFAAEATYPKAVKGKDGNVLEVVEKVTVEQSVYHALLWIENRIRQSDIGLIEFKSTNPRGVGIPNQAWKDGRNSYRHPNGEMVNYQKPVAPLEVQAVSADALLNGARLFSEKDPDAAVRWREMAETLQTNTIKQFWMDERQYFALAIDRDPKTNAPRQVKTMTANAGRLLMTGLFHALPEAEQKKYVGGIWRNLMSPNFLTNYGIRSRALEHIDMVRVDLDKIEADLARSGEVIYQGEPHVRDDEEAMHLEYQGSEAVWHKETWEVTQGGKKWGFTYSVDQLNNRHINGQNIPGGSKEMIYVDRQGRLIHPVILDNGREVSSIDSYGGNTIVRPGTNIGEDPQGWSASALRGAKTLRTEIYNKKSYPNQTNWQAELEGEIFTTFAIPEVTALKTIAEIEQARLQRKAVVVDLVRGGIADRTWDYLSVA